MHVNGAIDYTSLEKIIKKYNDFKIPNIIMFSEFSEVAHLSPNEKSRLTKFVKENFNGDLTVNVSDNSISEIYKNVSYALEHSIDNIIININDNISSNFQEAFVIIEYISEVYNGNIILDLTWDIDEISMPIKIIQKITSLPKVIAIADNITTEQKYNYYKRSIHTNIITTKHKFDRNCISLIYAIFPEIYKASLAQSTIHKYNKVGNLVEKNSDMNVLKYCLASRKLCNNTSRSDEVILSTQIKVTIKKDISEIMTDLYGENLLCS